MSKIGKRLIKRLQGLLKKLQSDKPIEATQVEKAETPDGIVHIRKKVIFDGRRTDGETEGEAPEVF